MTVDTYVLSIRCLVTGLCNSESKCLRTYQPFLGRSPQQLDYRENWIYVYRFHEFSQKNILLVTIYKYHFCQALNWIHALWKSYSHSCISETSPFGWLGFSPPFSKDSDDEIRSYWTANCSIRCMSQCHIHATRWSKNILIVSMITTHQSKTAWLSTSNGWSFS